MQKKIRFVLVALLLAGLLLAALPALAGAPEALEWLRSQQNDDGGFGNPAFGSPDSTVGNTADAVQAIVAAGEDPNTWAKDGNTPLTFLAASVSGITTAGDMARVILAAVAAGENPRDFGGLDLVASLEGMPGDDGQFGGELDSLFGQCLSILALKSVSRPIPDAAVKVLKEAQSEAGIWAWNYSIAEGEGDNNSTAMAVMALIAAGEPTDGQAVQKAIAHFEGQQNDDGGFPYIDPSPYGTDSDANSTAVVLQALIAAGQDPATWVKGEANTPFTALAAFQNDDGSFAWQLAFPDPNFLATVQAIPALIGKPYPIVVTTVAEATVMPDTLPETGGILIQAGGLVLAGLVLAGSGVLLRHRR
ncbi:MAG: prenyltransferase/squalene oxidase repeat-containing protein [Chloroflexota bacterium]